MPDMLKLAQNKQRILTIIKESGPSLPARIARQTGVPPLFVSAFLSELVSDRELKLSNMKVGSSPLYFVEGQQPALANFIEYLNPKQKEAYHILKESNVLDDNSLAPAIRVALRSLKDFAIPVNAKIDGEIKLFWKYFQVPSSEIKNKITELISPQRQKPTQPKKEISQTIPPNQIISPKASKSPSLLEDNAIHQTPIISKPKKSKEPSEFSKSIREYLSVKDIEILEEISDKKREFTARIRIDTQFGKQEYFLIAKDKKSITDNDITLAHQFAQSKKMPALILSSATLSKKAQTHLNEWKNLVKFEKINN